MPDLFVPSEAIAPLTKRAIPAAELKRFAEYQERLTQVRSSWTQENDGVRRSLLAFEKFVNEPEFKAIEWFERYWLTLKEAEALGIYYSIELKPDHFMRPTVRSLLQMLSGETPEIAPRAARAAWKSLLERRGGNELQALVEVGFIANSEPEA